jgi:hypothetical protein
MGGIKSPKSRRSLNVGSGDQLAGQFGMTAAKEEADYG